MQNRHTCKTDIHVHAYMYSLQSNCIQMQKDATFFHIQVLFCYHEILFALSKTFTHTDVRTVNEAASRWVFSPHNFCFYSDLCRFSCLLSTLHVYFALNMHANQAYDMKLDQTKRSKRITFAIFTSYSLKLFFYCMLFQL